MSITIFYKTSISLGFNFYGIKALGEGFFCPRFDLVAFSIAENFGANVILLGFIFLGDESPFIGIIG